MYMQTFFNASHTLIHKVLIRSKNFTTPVKLGPVVQSIVSLTKLLVNDSLSLLVRLKSSVLICFAEKMRGAFALQKLLSFFQQKWQFFMYNIFEILTSR